MGRVRVPDSRPIAPMGPYNSVNALLREDRAATCGFSYVIELPAVRTSGAVCLHNSGSLMSASPCSTFQRLLRSIGLPDPNPGPLGPPVGSEAPEFREPADYAERAQGPHDDEVEEAIPGAAVAASLWQPPHPVDEGDSLAAELEEEEDSDEELLRAATQGS